MKDFYTLPEVAQSFKVSTRALWKWSRAGKLRITKLGRCSRISGEELERLITSGGISSCTSSTEKVEECHKNPNFRFRPAPPTPPEYFAKEDGDESRSRRVQLFMKPSIYNKLKELANCHHKSVNNMIETLIGEFTQTTSDNQEKRIWHKMEDELPKRRKRCLLFLHNDTAGHGNTAFDFAYITYDASDFHRPFWQAYGYLNYRIDEVEKWAYLSDILNIDEDEDNE